LRLERLNAMRESGARLMARDRLGRDMFARGAPDGLRVVRKANWDVSVDLMQAYGQIKARSQPVMHVVKRRACDDAGRGAGARRGWSAIAGELDGIGGPFCRPMPMTGAASASRRWRPAFLAMLELAKQGRVELQQARQFCAAAGEAECGGSNMMIEHDPAVRAVEATLFAAAEPMRSAEITRLCGPEGM
jgi:segregation and condensation protein A